MNKVLLTLALGAGALIANAQVVEVQQVTKVPVQGDLQVNIPRISPDGRFAVVSSNSDQALYRVDLTTGAQTRVAENGSALELSFTPGSEAIVYKMASVRDNHMRYYSVEGLELETGYHRTLAKAARHCASYTVSPSGVVSINAGGRFSARSFAGKKAQGGQAVVGIHYGHLEVTTPDGRTVNLDPQGKGSYLWPSLSPDGTKITYYLSGHGCFVCNLDGSDVRPLGYVHAPRWLNNDIVIGCQDYDNGQFITASTIVAANLNGDIQSLTDPALLGINPSASADGKAISFSTATGDLYVITLK